MKQRQNLRPWICYTAVALSFGAAVIHAWVMPEHFREWWGYGTFFLVTAIAQGVYSIALLRLPRRWFFTIGIAGNLAIIGLYVITRTHGIPLFGPHAGEVELVGVIDTLSTFIEIVLVLTLIVLYGDWRRRPNQKLDPL